MPFDIGFGELVLIGIVALIVIGPRDLPNLFRSVGRMTGRMRAMADDFRHTIESAADDAGYGDMKKDFHDLSNYAQNESGVREANSAIRDINNMKLGDRAQTADAQSKEEAVASSKSKTKSAQDLKAKSEAIKAEAKAEALRVQAEQAQKEAVEKRKIADASESSTQKKSIKSASSKKSNNKKNSKTSSDTK